MWTLRRRVSLRLRQISRKAAGICIDTESAGALSTTVEASSVNALVEASSLNSLASASEALKFYQSRQQASLEQTLSLREAVGLLLKVESLRPSAFDERLLALVQQILAQKESLSLSSIVEVCKSLQNLGLHEELPGLTSLAVESASFLPGDVIVPLAKTLALSVRKTPRLVDPSVHTAVFRILGEHVVEDMFEFTPEILGEALLAIASFHCGSDRANVHLTLPRAWLLGIFTPCGELLIGKATVLPSRALVKCLRAYKLVICSGCKLTNLKESYGSLEVLPIAIAEALVSKLDDLDAKAVVRSTHAIAALSNHGLVIGKQGDAFCSAALREIGSRAKELDVRDLSFALQASTTLLQRQLVTPSETEVLLQTLGAEVQRHISSLALKDALMMTKALARAGFVEPEGIVLDLLAAEFVRELRNLTPEQVCDITCAFGQLKFKSQALFEGLPLVIVPQLPRFQPRHLALTLHGLVKSKVHEERLFLEAGKHICKSLVGFTPRDMALSLWAFAKASHRHEGVFNAVQEDLMRQNPLPVTPEDASMLLWSISKVEVQINTDFLSVAAHYVYSNVRSFPIHALIVTCLGFARLGFARQPILIDIYRSLYGKLPQLTDSQLAFSYFLFSSSGIRDNALVNRFLHESKCRLANFRGQDFSNILLACSRAVSPTALETEHALREPFRARVFELLESGRLSSAPLLSIYVAAPSLLELTQAESIVLMLALVEHFEEMDASELVRCLVATVTVNFVHKPFLLPLFYHLRKKREYINSSEIISCVWAVHTLGFCKPKFRRTLAFILLGHVAGRNIAPRTLRDVLPALNEFGIWGRLPPSLQRTVWKIASDSLRQGVPPPPPASAKPADDLVPPSTSRKRWLKENWRMKGLTPLVPGLLRKGFRQRRGAEKIGYAIVQRAAGWDAKGLKSMKKDAEELEKSEQKEREALDAARASSHGTKSAVQDFVEMIRKL